MLREKHKSTSSKRWGWDTQMEKHKLSSSKRWGWGWDTQEEKRIKLMSNYSKLPHDLLVIIANKLSAIEDFVSFTCVCYWWRSAVPKEQWNPSIPRLPWLLVKKKHENQGQRFLFSMEKKKLYNLKQPLLIESQPLLLESGAHCLGSVNGWISNGSSLIINPETRVQFSVPPILHFESKIAKAFVSQMPNNDVVVFVIYSGGLQVRFAKPGFKQWINIQDDQYNKFADLVCYKGRVFAVRPNGTLVLCEIDWSPKAIDVAPPPPLKYSKVYSIYLVESNGDLLMALQYDNRDTVERAFEVYKFNADKGEWMKLKDLGGCTLFLSHSYSVSIRPMDELDCRANCIYYTTLKGKVRMYCYLDVVDMKDNATEHYSLTNLSEISDYRGTAWFLFKISQVAKQFQLEYYCFITPNCLLAEWNTRV